MRLQQLLIVESDTEADRLWAVEQLLHAGAAATLLSVGLKKGDRVLTTGGIYGTIQGVEPDAVYLKIAENVKVKVARSAISGVVAGENEA